MRQSYFRMLFCLTIGVIILAVSQPLSAVEGMPLAGATVTPNTFNDDFDPAADFDSICSLREALYTVMGDADYGGCTNTGIIWGKDTIFLDEGTYMLTVTGNEEEGKAGDLDIYPFETGAPPSSIYSPSADQPDITIQGYSESYSTINALENDRVFHIQAGVSVLLNRVAISGGHPYETPDPSGGGILNYGWLKLTYSPVYMNSTPVPGDGGGISNHGTLTLEGVALYYNYTENSTSAENTGNGGGIYNSGTMTATDSFIRSSHTGNTTGTATAGVGAGIYNSATGDIMLNRVTLNENVCGNTVEHAGAMGGGIFNDGALRIYTSTISSNRSGSVIPGENNYIGGMGAGILNYTNGTITIIADSTIAFNQCGYSSGTGKSHGGGLVMFDGTATIRNTIIADNVADYSEDCSGSGIISDGHNLIESADGCTPSGVGDTIFGQDPGLGSLEIVSNWNYMHRLMLGSPAIDAGPNTCGTPDQRHVSRPRDGDLDGTATCDIGAYEVYKWIFSPLIFRP